MVELFLGIDLGGSHISSWSLDKSGDTYSPFSRIDIGSDLNADGLLNHLTSFVRTATELTRGGHLVAIGLASPGPLDPYRGMIISPPNLPKVKNLEIVKMLQEKTDLPVFLINDADAAVLGEAWLGSAQGFKNVVILTLGTGVGSGIIAGGKLQRGRGMGGEWGHTTVFFSDQKRPCSCGRWNCLEAFCGTEGLVETYCYFFSVKRETLKQAEIYAVSEKMRRYHDLDSQWRKVFDVYCHCLTEGIINIANIHHPDCVVLGGGIACSDIVEMIKKNLEMPNDLYPNPSESQYKLGILLEGLEIRLAVLDRPGVVGAAKYAMDCHEAIVSQLRAEHGVYS